MGLNMSSIIEKTDILAACESSERKITFLPSGGLLKIRSSISGDGMHTACLNACRHGERTVHRARNSFSEPWSERRAMQVARGTHFSPQVRGVLGLYICQECMTDMSVRRSGMLPARDSVGCLLGKRKRKQHAQHRNEHLTRTHTRASL